MRLEKYKGKTLNVNYETTFSKKQKFKCEKCGFCCYSKDIELSDSDIKKIAGNTTFKESYFAEKIKDTVKLKTKDNKCIFLDNKNKCEIYPFRPSTCKNYPYKIFFEKPNFAYIDISKNCPAVTKNNSKTNEIDFDKLIIITKKEMQKNPELFNFISNLKEKIKHNLDKKIAVDKLFDYIFSESNNLLSLLKNIILSNQLKKEYDKLRFADVDEIIEKLRKKKLELTQQEFNTHSFNFIKNIDELKAFDIKTNKTYFIYPKKIDAKKLQKVSYKINNFEPLKNYLKEIWNKKLMEYEIYTYVVERLKAGKDLSSLEFQLDVYEKIILLLNFAMLFISYKNKSKKLNTNNINEAIIITDPLIRQISAYIRGKDESL